MTTLKKTIGIVALVLGILAVIGISANAGEDKKDTLVLSKDNIIVLNAEVDGDSVGAVLEAARKLDNKFLSDDSKPIYLFLNTPGGSIQAGLELIEGLKALKRPVHTITMFAASMGFQIAQNMGDRNILQNGVLMSHRAYGGFEGEFGGAAPSQIDSRYALWISRITEMDQQTVNRTNGKQTLESYQKQYASEMWITGNQSVAQGYADKVVKVSCDKTLNGVTTYEISFMGIPIKYDLSNCPTNTSPMNIRLGIRTNRGTKTVQEFIDQKGGFGFACQQALATNPEQICAIDANLTLEKVYGLTSEFKSHYEKKQRQVIRMQIGK